MVQYCCCNYDNSSEFGVRTHEQIITIRLYGDATRRSAAADATLGGGRCSRCFINSAAGDSSCSPCEPASIHAASWPAEEHPSTHHVDSEARCTAKTCANQRSRQSQHASQLLSLLLRAAHVHLPPTLMPALCRCTRSRRGCCHGPCAVPLRCFARHAPTIDDCVAQPGIPGATVVCSHAIQQSI